MLTNYIGLIIFENYSAIFCESFCLKQTLSKKMRLNQIFFKTRHHAKAQQNENKVPFKELKPLVLQNQVARGKVNSKDYKCLFEMSLLFKCWVDYEYDNRQCEKYMNDVQKCYKNYITYVRQQKISQKNEIPVPGSKSLTNKQYTYLLQQYPTI